MIYYRLALIVTALQIIFTKVTLQDGLLLRVNVLHTPIDAVILWVNGSDPNWIKRYKQKVKEFNYQITNDDFEERYIERNELVLVFTCIEKYMPWINKIHLVVDDQVPYWLNLSHPKIRIVSHSQIFGMNDYHSFNSLSIQVYLFNIPDLSERFILFDDDTAVVGDFTEEDFFREDGMPLMSGSFGQDFELQDMDKRIKGCKRNPHLSGDPRYKANVAVAAKAVYNEYHKVPNLYYGHVIQPLLKSFTAEIYDIYGLDNYHKYIFRSCKQVHFQTLFINHLYFKYSVPPVIKSAYRVYDEKECQEYVDGIEVFSKKKSFLCFNRCTPQQINHVVKYYGGSSFVLKGSLPELIGEN